MIIQWEGRAYTVGFTDLTVKQAEAIETETGMTIGSWLDVFSDGFGMDHPQFLRMLKVVFWLMLDQNGEKTPIGAVDFPIVKFGHAFMQAAAAEDAAAARAPATPVAPVDPTLGARFPATPSPAPSTLPAGFQPNGTPAVPLPAQG